jgi:hypothetical protein
MPALASWSRSSRKLWVTSPLDASLFWHIEQGVTDKSNLIELCMVGNNAMEELVNSLEASKFSKLMLSTSLRRRFPAA